MTDTTTRTYTDAEIVDVLAGLFATDDPINGGDLVELVGTYLANRAPVDYAVSQLTRDDVCELGDDMADAVRDHLPVWVAADAGTVKVKVGHGGQWTAPLGKRVS